MSHYTDTMKIHVALTEYGDALIYGSTSMRSTLPGMELKHLLFAWHEESLYGTELAVEAVDEVEVIILPAEQVVSFFAELRLLEHIEWTWDEETAMFMKLAARFAAWIEAQNYVPSLDAFRQGKLSWTWDERALEPDEREMIKLLADSPYYKEGLEAAFSAAVDRLRYTAEAAEADLRREYPLLFAADRSAADGMDQHAWLIHIGWRPDTAPFRPLLQLLEPDEEAHDWRLLLMLQDKQDAGQLIPIGLKDGGSALGSWPEAWDTHIHERAAAWLTGLRAALPADMLVEGGSFLGQPLSDEQAWRFLTEVSHRLLQTGWQVLLPAWWEAARRKQPKLRAKLRAGEGGEGAQGGRSMFGLDSLISFDWRIAIGETSLTEAEFKELVARGERLVRFRNEWIPLDPALVAQIRQMMDGMNREDGLSFQDILQLHLLESEGERKYSGAPARKDDPEKQLQTPERVKLAVELNEHFAKLLGQLVRQKEWPSVPVPDELKATLRTYQQEGFSWLAFMRRYGLGACLADDMGLGKTVQFIAYLLHVKAWAVRPNEVRLPSLLICPTSVLGNWQKELERFAPSLRVVLHYGSRRKTDEAFFREVHDADIVLTSYATAALDQEMLREMKWETIGIDEAQNIKNAETRQSIAVRSLRARHRVALTGTPIENRLSELWSIYDFINPGYLGSLRGFSSRFIQAIEKGQDEQRMADLQMLIKPFMLRRKKKDPAIQLDLPEKNEMKTYIHLTAEQSALYDQTVQELLQRMEQLEGIERKGAILAALTQFKQLCDHPILLTKEPLPELPASARRSGSEEIGGPLIDTEAVVRRSAKLERLLAMVKELREEGDRCLIFTQYIGMGEMMQRVLQQELQEPVLYLNGSTPKRTRDRMIEQFQSRSLPPEAQPNVMILSIKAGGVGLNLTAANHVFHFDRWWNPAVENQATDRAYRMGQTKDVQVYKFISMGTLEERIDEMLESKQQLSDQIISSGEGWITELSTDELKDLFTLRRDWA